MTFFSAAVPPIDRRQHRLKQISTRLYILFFIISLAFPVYLVVVSVKNPIKKAVSKNMITIVKPSLTQYYQLLSMYPESLMCPCSQSSIYYGEFLNVEYTFHEVCSSIFVGQDWINQLVMPAEMRVLPNDFRSTSSSSFQALSSFCKLAYMTLDNNLGQFYSNQYLSTFVIPPQIFESQIMMQIDLFTSLAINNFLLSFSMIKSIIQNNALFSGLQTNYRQFIQNTDVISSAVRYQGCSCAYSARCTEPSRIYNYSEMTSLFTVPGFYTGCYVTESLLQSNLQCFYDQNCIDQLQTYLPSVMQVSALGSSMASMYLPNTTIEELLNGLMIEQWSISVSYESYYDQCRPMHCTYDTEMVETTDTVEVKNYIAYLVGILIGIVGGMIAIVNLIVPRLAELIVYGIGKRRIQATLDISVVQT